MPQPEPGEFLFNLGEPIEAPVGRRGGGLDVESTAEFEVSSAPRGLALKSFTLTKGHEGWFGRLLNRPDELVIAATSFDLSGGDPFVFPAKIEDVQQYYSAKRGETITWTLGDGFPVFVPRQIVGGVVVGIQVAESDAELVKIAEALVAASDAVKSDGKIADILKAISMPGKFAADQLLGALTEVSKVLGTVIKKYEEDLDPVGLAAAQFSATDSWEGKLEQTLDGGHIVLVETR